MFSKIMQTLATAFVLAITFGPFYVIVAPFIH
jgi:hypothetical protein